MQEGGKLQEAKAAKAVLLGILLVTAVLSVFFVSRHDNPHDLLCYVVNGFLITEWTVVGSALFFDTMSTVWHKYKIRKNHATSPALVERSIWERIKKYKTEWFTYTATWLLSRMSFDQEYPGVVLSVLQVAALCLFFDGYIYTAYMWMHTLHGHSCHKKHHSFRYVDCWFVDHESQLESVIIGVGKHGALAYFSPHPRTAFEYLFVTKLWNVVAHCGYDLPLFQFVDKYIPFLGTPNRHEQHHFHGDTNLSIFTTIFDYVGDTLVWTDQEAVEWRRDNRSSRRGGDRRVSWKLDPSVSKA